MKINQSAVVSTVLGVLLAGLALRYMGNLPVLKDARLGFDGNAK